MYLPMMVSQQSTYLYLPTYADYFLSDEDKYYKTIIVHLKHTFYGKYTYEKCSRVPWVP